MTSIVSSLPCQFVKLSEDVTSNNLPKLNEGDPLSDEVSSMDNSSWDSSLEGVLFVYNFDGVLILRIP